MKKIILILSMLFVSLNAEQKIEKKEDLSSKNMGVVQLFNKKLVKVKKKEVNLSKDFYGDIKIPDNAIKDVSLRFNGFIGNIYLGEEYTYVNKEDKLFNVYSDEINLAMSEYLITDKNLKQNYKSKFDSYDINEKVLAQLDKTNKVKEYIEVYSKYNGFIISKKKNEGSYVKKGSNILQIADLDKLWVIAKIYQEDLKTIKKGMKTKIYINGNKKLSSQVDYIYPNVNQKDKTINVRMVIENKDLDIYPNMFVKVSINTLKKTMFVLPKTAVLTKADKHFVFIPNGKEFEPKEITAVRINSREFEVYGLSENEVVIDKAMFLLDSDSITNGLYDSEDEDEDW